MSSNDKYSSGGYLLGLVLFTFAFFKLPEERDWIKWIPLVISILCGCLIFGDRLEKKGNKIKHSYLLPTLLGSALFFYFISIESTNNSRLLVFKDYLDGYLSIIDSLNYSNSESIKEKNFNGTVLPIDLEKKKIDIDTYFKLPKQLVSNDPGKVQILVFIKRGSAVVNRYNDGSEAIKLDCNIKIVELMTKKVISEKTIFGSDPPTTKRRGSGCGVGSDPEVINYISSLLCSSN